MEIRQIHPAQNLKSMIVNGQNARELILNGFRVASDSGIDGIALVILVLFLVAELISYCTSRRNPFSSGLRDEIRQCPFSLLLPVQTSGPIMSPSEGGTLSLFGRVEYKIPKQKWFRGQTGVKRMAE